MKTQIFQGLFLTLAGLLLIGTSFFGFIAGGFLGGVSLTLGTKKLHENKDAFKKLQPLS